LRADSASFIQVQTTTECTRLEVQSDIQFELPTGRLTLPASLPTTQIVNIIKGLSEWQPRHHQSRGDVFLILSL